MECKQCHAPLEAGAKFCTNCGAHVSDEASKSQTETPTATEVTTNEQANGQPAQSKATDYVAQGKAVSKQYWNFIPNALLNPFAASTRVKDTDKVNGLITLALFSLLIPLFTYSAIGSYYRPPFLDTVLKPFMVLLIFFAILLAVKFGVAKLMKADISFVQVMTRFGTLMVLPTTLALLAVVFAFLNSYTFSTVLMLLSISFASIASMATIFSIKTAAPKTGGIDVVYGVIITYVAMAIVLLIIGDSIMGNLIGELQNNFY